jgi:ribosomal protein L7Ae-like RNA K-turn-binding protein
LLNYIKQPAAACESRAIAYIISQKEKELGARINIYMGREKWRQQEGQEEPETTGEPE